MTYWKLLPVLVIFLIAEWKNGFRNPGIIRAVLELSVVLAAMAALNHEWTDAIIIVCANLVWLLPQD